LHHRKLGLPMSALGRLCQDRNRGVHHEQAGEGTFPATFFWTAWRWRKSSALLSEFAISAMPPLATKYRVAAK
jgi:hypothetical protein